jgi:hypothetical protein
MTYRVTITNDAGALVFAGYIAEDRIDIDRFMEQASTVELAASGLSTFKLPKDWHATTGVEGVFVKEASS